MEFGPEKFTITEYWQCFKQELDALINEWDPNHSIDFWPVVQSLFPKEDELSLKAFVGTMRQSPSSLAQSSKSSVAIPQIDPQGLRYYVIAMRMCEQGIRLESLPKISARGDSQRSVGQRIEQFQQLFGEKNLPEATSPTTLEFVNVYINNSKRFAEGLVYSTDSVANKFLGQYVEQAQTNCLILKRSLERYKRATKSKGDSEIIGEALTQACPWLHHFDSHYQHFISLFIKEHILPEKPKVSESATEQKGWDWGWWYSLLSWSSSTEASSVKADEPSEQPPPKPDYISKLEARYAKCIALSHELFYLQEICTMASSFEIIDTERSEKILEEGFEALSLEKSDKAETSAKDFSNPIYIANELNRPLTLLAEFYQKVLQMVEAYPRLDDFTKAYFALVESTAIQLEKALNKEFPPLESNTLKMLNNFSISYLKPHEYQLKWAQHFGGQFLEPGAINHLIHRSMPPAAAKPTAKISAPRFLSKIFTKLNN